MDTINTYPITSGSGLATLSLKATYPSYFQIKWACPQLAVAVGDFN